MLSIQQIQYILAINETGQFQKASEKCFVTQPTLSIQVKKAEEELGYPIFDRARNPLELTAFGKEIIPVLNNLIEEYNKIDVLTKKQKGEYFEEIKIGIIPTISSYLIPDLFIKWQQSIDNGKLILEEMKTEELLLAMERRTIDMAILAGPVNDPKYRVTKLYEEEILAYIPEIKKNEISSADLQNLHPWLLNKGNCLRTQMIHFCSIKKERDKESWDYEGGNLDLLIKMVDINGGYTLIPEFYIKDEKSSYKSILDETTNEKPARQIISLSYNRSAKWPLIERIIREIQFAYNKKDRGYNLQILNWK